MSMNDYEIIILIDYGMQITNIFHWKGTHKGPSSNMTADPMYCSSMSSIPSSVCWTLCIISHATCVALYLLFYFSKWLQCYHPDHGDRSSFIMACMSKIAPFQLQQPNKKINHKPMYKLNTNRDWKAIILTNITTPHILTSEQQVDSFGPQIFGAILIGFFTGRFSPLLLLTNDPFMLV